jgi:hypothetical protein
MINELREIEKELNRLRVKVQRMINLLEKRRVRLETLEDDELIGEAAERTLPAQEIAELLGKVKKRKKKP